MKRLSLHTVYLMACVALWVAVMRALFAPLGATSLDSRPTYWQYQAFFEELISVTLSWGMTKLEQPWLPSAVLLALAGVLFAIGAWKGEGRRSFRRASLTFIALGLPLALLRGSTTFFSFFPFLLPLFLLGGFLYRVLPWISDREESGHDWVSPVWLAVLLAIFTAVSFYEVNRRAPIYTADDAIDLAVYENGLKAGKPITFVYTEPQLLGTKTFCRALQFWIAGKLWGWYIDVFRTASMTSLYLLVLALYLVGKELNGRFAGFAAGLVLITRGSTVFPAIQLAPLLQASAALMFLFFFFWRGMAARSAWRFLIAGGICGYGVYMYQIALFYIPMFLVLLVVWICFWAREGWRGWRYLGVFVVGMLLTTTTFIYHIRAHEYQRLMNRTLYLQEPESKKAPKQGLEKIAFQVQRAWGRGEANAPRLMALLGRQFFHFTEVPVRYPNSRTTIIEILHLGLFLAGLSVMLFRPGDFRCLSLVLVTAGLMAPNLVAYSDVKRTTVFLGLSALYAGVFLSMVVDPLLRSRHFALRAMPWIVVGLLGVPGVLLASVHGRTYHKPMQSATTFSAEVSRLLKQTDVIFIGVQDDVKILDTQFFPLGKDLRPYHSFDIALFVLEKEALKRIMDPPGGSILILKPSGRQHLGMVALASSLHGPPTKIWRDAANNFMYIWELPCAGP